MVCYELPVFRNLDAPQVREFALQLLANGLDWVWQSARAHPDEATRRHLPTPESRASTLLTMDTASDFVVDLLERDEVEGYTRFVALFGVTPAAARDLMGHTATTAIRDFCQERGGIQICVIQIGDSQTEFVFVPHQRTRESDDVLAHWGIRTDLAYPTRPYRKLYTASLESIFQID